MTEGPITIGVHGFTIVVGLAQLGFMAKLAGPALREYKIWTRLKERVNTLWFDRCKVKGDDYVPLENGKH